MSANLEIGSLLHKRYRIVEVLGQGGMGSVYRAVDENLGVDVAVKENLFTTDEYARQFRLEAVILASLRQINMPRVTDHFVVEGQGQYLIMDYIDGEDLRTRMELGVISEDEATVVGLAICDALQYLHTRNPSIIHRDLKPGNVRITSDGHIYLVDFGLAKLVKGDQATSTGARAMTPGYSPPEQYGTGRTDPRTDIYSLGATLYAALTGTIPEDGLARAMDNVELTSLRQRNPKVSRKLAVAIEKALAVRPEDRFQTAQEFKQALLASRVKSQPLVSESDLQLPPRGSVDERENLSNEDLPQEDGNDVAPPLPPATVEKSHGSKWWVFFSLLPLMVIVILIAWHPGVPGNVGLTSTPSVTSAHTSKTSSLPNQNTNTPFTQTPTGLLTASGSQSPLPTYLPPDTPTPTETLGPTPTLLGGGTSQFAFVSDRTGSMQIFVMKVEKNSEPQQITNMTYGACQPAWSPDGLQLVVISPCTKRLDQYPEARLYMINADGSGTPVQLASGDSGDFDPAWSPDGKHIAFTSLRDGSSQIYVLNLEDNQVTQLTRKIEDTAQPDWSAQPAWSPDGKQIVYTAHSRLTETKQIWLMSATGDNKVNLLPRGTELWNFLPAWSTDGTTILFSETQGAQALGWIMRYNILTTNVSHLRAAALGTHGDYSPDGQWVIYESIDSKHANRIDYDIYYIKADGSGAIIRLNNDLTMEFDPAWRSVVAP
jgi:eukaryotic-like serine/threonine-protein kinase